MLSVEFKNNKIILIINLTALVLNISKILINKKIYKIQYLIIILIKKLKVVSLTHLTKKLFNNRP